MGQWLVLLVAAVLCQLSGCRCPGQTTGGARVEQACASACAALVSAGCAQPGLAKEDHPRCVQECVGEAKQHALADCEQERFAYLECVSTTPVDCARAECSAAVCLEHATVSSECAAQFTRFQSCLAPCLFAGTAQLIDRKIQHAGALHEVRAELVRGGCTTCEAALKQGAKAGSPCSSEDVCSQFCCSCTDRSRYLVRACIDGQCAERGAACALTRQKEPTAECR